MKHFLFLLLCLGMTLNAYAQTNKKPVIKPVPLRPYSKPQKTQPHNGSSSHKSFDRFYANAGFHTEYFNNVQTDDSGTLRRMDFAPTIGMGLQMPFRESVEFLPEFNWMLPKTSNKVIKNLFMLRGDFGYSPVDWFRMRMGTSLMWLNQHGQGGKKKLNNGSDQSTFYYPSENRSSLNNTFDIGGEFLFDHWALRLQTYTYSIFRQERRQISYTLFVTYYWDR